MTPGVDNLVQEIESIQTQQDLSAWKGEHSLSEDLVRRVVSRIQHLLDADARTALRLSEWALSIAIDLNEPGIQAHALRAKGAALVRTHDYVQAIEYFDEALGHYEALGRKIEAAKTITNRINAYQSLSRYDEALADAERVTRTFDEAGDERSKVAHLLNVALIYFRLDRFDDQLKILGEAETIALKLNDARILCKVYRNRAVTLTSLNRATEAFRDYELAGRLATEQDMARTKAECDYNICYLYFLQGQYTKALEHMNQVREQMRAVGDRWHTALCDLDQAEIYLELNMHRDAIELAQKAYASFDALSMRYEMAKALAFTGVAHSHLRQYGAALELFDRARVMFQAENNQVWLRLVDLYQAIVYFQTGRFFEGLALARQAREFFDQAGLRTKAIYALLLMARLDLQIGRVDAAERQALECLEAANNPPVQWLIYQAHYVLGDVCLRLGDKEAARKFYRLSIDGLEVLRTNIQVDELRMTFVKDKLKIYESLVSVGLDSGDPAAIRDCFDAVERAKSRTLVDLLANNIQAVAPSKDTDSQLVNHLGSIREELNWYYTKINSEEEKGAPRATLHRLFDEMRVREDQLVQLLRQIPSGTSDYISLQRVTTSTLEEIQSAILEDNVLLEYYIVDNQIVVFVVSRDGFQVFTDLALVPTVRNAFELLRFQLTKFNLGTEYIEKFRGPLLHTTHEHLRELYEYLIAPVLPLLAGRKGVTIVAHDFLHYIPFHALFDGIDFMVDRFEVSYAPSASIFHVCSQRKRTTTGKPLLLGVPDARTPFIRDEIEAIQRILPDANVFIGSEATAARLRKYSADCQLIHIASHGAFRQDNPMFSSIQLGDTRLSLFDVYNLRVSADFVALSGCGTGMSSVIAGDELLGLVRGFLYAGARSLLVSLWDVHDKMTAELMQEFYGAIVQGAPRAESLRMAMLEMKSRQPHPYYWAPFILMGGPS